MEDRKAPMERPPPPPPPVHTGDGGNEGSELPWPTRLCEALLAPEKASKQPTRSDRTRSAVSAVSAPRDAYSTDFLMLIEAEATRVLAIQGSVPFEIIQKATECCHASLSYRSGQHELAALARSLVQHGITTSAPRLQWMAMHILLYQALQLDASDRSKHISLHCNIGLLAEEIGCAISRPGFASREFMRAFCECVNAIARRPDLGRLEGIEKQLTRSASVLASVTIRQNRPVLQSCLDIKQVRLSSLPFLAINAEKCYSSKPSLLSILHVADA